MPIVSLFFLVFGFLSFAQAASLDPVSFFEYQGKSYKLEDLTQGFQQRSYDIFQQAFKEQEKLFGEFALNLYLEQQAKQQNISLEEMKKTFLTPPTITEATMKDFYEIQKPYLSNRPFEELKPQIRKFLEDEGNKKFLAEKIDFAKKQGKFKLLIPPPSPPKARLDLTDFPKKGSEKPKVVIVEFADYFCHFCKIASQNLKKLLTTESQVQVVFVDFPTAGSLSYRIAEGSHCAQLQGKFWEYHYAAFEKQSHLNPQTPGIIAKEIGLNLESFEQCLKSGQGKKLVLKGENLAKELALNATPILFANGEKLPSYDLKIIQDYVKSAVKN